MLKPTLSIFLQVLPFSDVASLIAESASFLSEVEGPEGTSAC